MPSVGVYSKPIEQLLTRLQGHSTGGGLLAGVNVVPLPVQEVEGIDDYPVVRAWVDSVSEGYRVHESRGVLAVRLVVSDLRENGWSSFMELVEKVMDGCEYPHGGTVDPGLSGAIAKPLQVALGLVAVKTNSINATVLVTMETRPRERAKRRLEI